MAEDAADRQSKDKEPILDDGQDRKIKASAVKIALKVTAGLIVLAILISIPTFFTREARVKRSFNSAMSAFENLDTEKTLDFISADYSDNWGNTKQTFEQVIPLIFNQFSGIKVMIAEMEIEFDGPDTAVLTVSGKVIIKQKDETMGALRPDAPVTMTLKKEDGKWRMTTADGMNMNIEAAFQEVF